MPSTILPPDGTNLQRWMLIKLLQYPATDRLGAARDNTQQLNVVWNCLIDWQQTIRNDSGAYGWGEVKNAWALCLIEASLGTISAINADARTQSILVPNILIDNIPNAAQRTQILNFLQNNLGISLSEISSFDLSDKPLRRIFQFLNRGVCNRTWDDVLKIITFDTSGLIGFHKAIDDIIDEFNSMKTHAAL